MISRRPRSASTRARAFSLDKPKCVRRNGPPRDGPLAATSRSATERPATVAVRLARPRIVRRGLSWRSVSAPIRMASTCARSCIACRRAAGPVIQRPSSGDLVRRPSRLIPHFAITNGRPVTIHLLNASFSWLHSAARTPLVTSIPAARSARRIPRPPCCGLGSIAPITTRPTPALTIASGAGRRAPGRGAGLERDVERGRPQVSRAAAAERHSISACGNPLAR